MSTSNRASCRRSASASSFERTTRWPSNWSSRRRNTTRTAGSEVKFPTGQWVHIQTHVVLSDEAGLVQIWQDGRKVLDKTGRTLPLADTIYDRFELGITALAKGARYEKVLYVDDVVISDSEIP